jgi:glucose 1-dehydrogenase
LNENKVAIVTGGNSGIGEAIVLALAADGASLVIDYVVNPERAESVVKKAVRAGGKAVSVKADISKVEDIKRLIETAVDQFGRLDVMINNAGIESRRGLLETEESDYDRVMDINIKGAFFGAQLAARQMIQQGSGGTIINISSVHEERPMPGNIAYCCSKGAMRMLTRTAAVELADKGIRVVGVGPGAVATPINEGTMENQEKMDELRASIPLGEMAQPEQIAALVTWLASDQAGYVTATTYFVDGGMLQASPGL